MHTKKRLFSTMALLCLLTPLARAAPTSPIDNPRYDLPTSQGPDAEAKGWMINLGITGLRVRLEENAPKTLTVGYVFPNSPAANHLQVGDVITGTGSHGRFSTAHKFGYGMDK